MSLNRLLILFVLLLSFLLSGIEHRLLYFLFMSLGFLVIIDSDFKIQLDRNVRLLFFSIAFLFVLLLTQVIINYQGAYQIIGFGRYFMYFLLFLFLRTLKRETLTYFLLSSTWILILSLPYALKVSFIDGTRFQFYFDHANHLAYVSVSLIVFFLEFSTLSKRANIFYVMALSLILLASKSSGGLVTFSIALSFHFLKGLKLNFFFKALSGVVLLFGLGLFVSLSDRFMEQLEFLEFYDISFIVDRALNHEAGGVGSGLWRIIYWISILIAFFNESLLILLVGVGFDTMSSGHYYYDFMTHDPHNDYVRIIVELGIFGFLLNLFLQWLLIKNWKRNRMLFIVIALPMFFGNVIVNFPYALMIITLAVLVTKPEDEKNSINYTT